MSSFTNLLIVVFFIQLTLITLGIANIPGDSLYNFVTNPADWDTSQLIGVGADALFAIGGAVAFVGLFIFKSDFIVFAGLASIFLSFGKGLGVLYSLISAQVGNTFANFVVAPIVIVYVLTLFSWWRGRSG